MRSRLWIIVLAALVAVLTAVGTGTALAASSQAACATSAGTAGVPHGAVAVEDITYTMLNSNDGGNVGIWALDDGFCHVQVWRLSRGDFYAAVTESGTWTTFAGALSPGNGVPEPAGGSGPFFAHFTETFSGAITPGVQRFGYLGTIDFGETEADILLGTYDKQSGNANTWDPFNSYYNNVSNVNVLTTYGIERYRNQAFIYTVTDNNYNSTGDIVIPS